MIPNDPQNNQTSKKCDKNTRETLLLMQSQLLSQSCRNSDAILSQFCGSRQPKTANEGPRPHQDGPRPPEDPPKRPPKDPKSVQTRQERDRNGSFYARPILVAISSQFCRNAVAVLWLKTAPRLAQERPKTTPRAPQGPPKRPPNDPQNIQTLQKCDKNATETLPFMQVQFLSQSGRNPVAVL